MALIERDEEELRRLEALDELWHELYERVEALNSDELTLDDVLRIVDRLSEREAKLLVARDLIEAREGTLPTGIGQV